MKIEAGAEIKSAFLVFHTCNLSQELKGDFSFETPRFFMRAQLGFNCFNRRFPPIHWDDCQVNEGSIYTQLWTSEWRFKRVNSPEILKDTPPLLIGGLEHDFYDFPYIGNVIIPTDKLIRTRIFQRGRYTTNQFVSWSSHVWVPP